MAGPTPVKVDVHIEADSQSHVVVNVTATPRSRGKDLRTANVTQPGANAVVRVRVDPATGLGYICARGTENDFNTTTDQMKGMVYPGTLSEMQIDQTPPVSARTATVDANGNWCFEGGNAGELPGCAHGTTGLEPTNTLGIWHLRGTNVEEIKVQNFRGLRSTETECTVGSGSWSSDTTPESELAGFAVLVIQILDGRLKGEHLAMRVRPMLWQAEIGGKTVTLFSDPKGTTLAMTGPVNMVACSIEPKPFSANFDGAQFDSKQEVVVMAKQ